MEAVNMKSVDTKAVNMDASNIEAVNIQYVNSEAVNSQLSRDSILSLVLSSLQEVLSTQVDGDAEAIELSEETKLLGRSSVLDSMGLVTLVVDVEQQLEEQFDVVLILADERAMSQTRSPFVSVGVFVDYIYERVQTSLHE